MAIGFQWKKYIITNVRPTNNSIYYNKTLQCYNKSLELNPNFEPAKNAKKEVKTIF